MLKPGGAGTARRTWSSAGAATALREERRMVRAAAMKPNILKVVDKVKNVVLRWSVSPKPGAQ